MKDLIRRLKPSCFEDIVALVALFRPGRWESPAWSATSATASTASRAVRYPHPWLEPILENTYGVILYQEQVMQIAQVLAATRWRPPTCCAARWARRSPKEMAQAARDLPRRCARQRHRSEVAGAIFDLMEKFAGYGFNKSHSAAYAWCLQTAWLKRHFPAEFMARCCPRKCTTPTRSSC